MIKSTLTLMKKYTSTVSGVILFYMVRYMEQLSTLLTLAISQRRINQRTTVGQTSKETTKEIKASVQRKELIRSLSFRIPV